MDWIAIGTIIGSTVTALGGFEFIKWWFNRGTHSRKEAVGVKAAEQSLYAKEIDRYVERLADRDAKVDSIYRELRETQGRELALIEEINKLKLEKQLLLYQKCEVRGCANRKPPGDY